MKPEAAPYVEANRHNTKQAASSEHARVGGHHHSYHNHHRNHIHSAPVKSSGLVVNGGSARPHGAAVEKPSIHNIKNFIGPALPPQNNPSLVSSELRKEGNRLSSYPSEIKTFIGPELPPLPPAMKATTVEKVVMGPSAAGALSDGRTEALSLSQAPAGPQLPAEYDFDGESWIPKRKPEARSGGKKRGRDEQVLDDKEDGKRLRLERSPTSVTEQQEEEQPVPMDVCSDRPW